MADNLIRMQHSTKGSAGFTHGAESIDSDESGIISIPAHLTGHAAAHGFSAIAERGPKKLEPLAKASGAKAGEDEAGEGDDVKESKAQKGSKASGAKAGE